MECKKEQNLQNCPCSYPDCPRKGLCCECVAHHRKKGEIPACFFPIEAEENSLNDRSVENFIKGYEAHKKKMEDINKQIEG